MMKPVFIIFILKENEHPKNHHLPFYFADPFLSGRDFPFYAFCLPVFANLFTLCTGSLTETRLAKRRMACRQKNHQLQSLGRKRLRSRSVI